MFGLLSLIKAADMQAQRAKENEMSAADYQRGYDDGYSNGYRDCTSGNVKNVNNYSEKENNMPMNDETAYDRGYDAGLIMGRGEVLAKYKEKKKLTRKEAVRVVNKQGFYGEMLVNALEALGLIEFAESEKDAMFYFNGFSSCNLAMLNDIVGKQGYQIVKKA